MDPSSPSTFLQPHYGISEHPNNLFTVNTLALQEDKDWYQVTSLSRAGSIRSHLDQHEDFPPHRHRKKTCFQKFKDFLRNLFAMIFSSVGICVLVIGYLILGAVAFHELELPEERKTSFAVTAFRNKTVKRLWDITERFNTIHKMNWTIAVQKEVLDFQLHIVSQVGDGYKGLDNPVYQWTFSGSLLYSITVITTIGYGHISPSTMAGKILSMIYALVGMPLFLLYLSNVGHILATGFKWSYSKLCTMRRNRMLRKQKAKNIRFPPELFVQDMGEDQDVSFEQEIEEGDGENIEYDQHDPIMLDVISEDEVEEAEDVVEESSISDGNSRSDIESVHNEVALLESRSNSDDEEEDHQLSDDQGPEITQLQEIEFLDPSHQFDDDDDEPKQSLDTITVPITLCLALMISYICGGAVLFGKWEGWSFLDGSYFCFITLSTIGFGDIVPGDSLGQQEGSEGGMVVNVQFIFCSMYIILGMAVIAMCFNLMQEKVVQGVTSLGKKLGIIKDE